MLAYPLARMRFAGATLVSFAIAATYLVPQPLLFVPLADLINRLGLGDTLTSVILTYPTLLMPFCAWLLLGYFRTVPIELEDAARIDGASRLQTLVKIVLPLCGPGFISAGIFAFTLAQNEFLYALIFLTKTEVRTVPVGAIAELVQGRRVLLGPADGGGAARLDPGGDHLFVLRRALRRGTDGRLGQGVRSIITSNGRGNLPPGSMPGRSRQCGRSGKGKAGNCSRSSRGGLTDFLEKRRPNRVPMR